MNAAIWAAIIGGGAAVMAASLPLLRKRNDKKKEPNESLAPSSATVGGDGAAVVVGGSRNTVNVHAKSSDKLARLEIVDVEIDEPEEGFPFADIKVRNVGDEPAYATKVCLHITHCFVPREFRRINFSMQSVTWEYDLLLDGSCGVIERSISQIVEPKGADRFTIRLAQEVSPPDLPMLVRFDVSLLYDDGKESRYRETLIALVPNLLDVHGLYVADCDEELRIWNIQEIRKFSALPGKVSEWARGQFEEVSDAHPNRKGTPSKGTPSKGTDPIERDRR